MSRTDTIFTSPAYAVALTLLFAGIIRLEAHPESLVALYAIAVAVAFLAARPICALANALMRSGNRRSLASR